MPWHRGWRLHAQVGRLGAKDTALILRAAGVLS